MNNLANKTRFQLSTIPCRKLLFILFTLFSVTVYAQYDSPTICTDIEVSAFDEVYVDSISRANFQPPGHIDTICFTDVVSPEECTWNDFKGHFDISHWWFKADNHDGKLHTEGLPHSLSLEGAKYSPRNNYKRYVASLKSIAPTSGYVGFNWESYGGSFYDIDAFYFTVNDSCVQLTRSSQTSGHFVSWYVEAGDTISLEQTSNGTSNHITTRISHFQFIPEVYKIIDRTWKAVDHYADTTTCVQRILVQRPGLEDFILPPNRDGYDADFLSCTASLTPGRSDYPYIEGIRKRHYLEQQAWYDFSASYQDVLISQCGGNRTINRKWTITDHCSGATITKSQIIKQKDDSEIEIKCPQDQTFNITKCAVSVYIRKPRAWTSCNENIDVDVNWAYGSGSKVYTDVAPGRYEITFTARDGCGLEKTCSMWLNLVYNGQEEVTCKGDQYFTLPASGQLRIPVTDLVHRSMSACSGNLTFEINGSEYLDLDCSDVGSRDYTIRYFDPANPYDYKTCTIKINLSSNASEEITCKGNQYFTLPASGQLIVPVSNLVIRSSTTCSTDIRVEINGSENLVLDCYDLGSKDYTIRYFDPANPSSYKTCLINIDLSADGVDGVTCKGDQYFTLPSSGQLRIPVIDLVDRTTSTCSGDLKIEINGSEYLDLDCSDVGVKDYTVRYYDHAAPSDYKTCVVNINLSADGVDAVTCKGDQYYTLPSSGQLQIPVIDLVDRTTSNCSGDIRVEINGSEYLSLDCSDVGAKDYTVRYYDPANPSDYETCVININLVFSGVEVVSCKGDQSYTLPASGQMSVTVSDLITRSTTVCSGALVAQINGSETLNLDCNDVGAKDYTIRYFNPAYPSDYQTCTITIAVVSNGTDVVTCKGDQNLTLPASGQLTIPVSNFVNRASSSCPEDLKFEINGSENLILNCSDIGSNDYTISYYNSSNTSYVQTCSIKVILSDNGVEDVTCKEEEYVTLSASGQLSIPVSSLVIRTTTACSGDLKFEINGSENLALSCADVGLQNYTIHYFNPATPADYNTCTIKINVSGATGSITCPIDAEVVCGTDLSNLDAYGTAQASGVPSSSIVYEEDRQLNSCGVGFIIRTWSINPTCGATQSCSQRITVNDNGANIITEWPDDYTTDGCTGTVDLHPDALPATNARPSSNTSGSCGVITYNYSDSAASGDQYCYRIIRTWTASNSCDPNWSDTYNQTLEVKDLVKPVIYAPSDQIIYNNSAQCEGSYVSLVKTTVSDCDPDVTVTNNSPYAASSGENASGTYPLGITVVTWMATDRCGNTSSTTTKIEVVSTGDPTFNCVGELDIELIADASGTPTYELSASQLVASSGGGSSCGSTTFQYAFSENVNDVTVTLTCADVGLKGFDVFRFNGSQWLRCESWTRITAASGACTSGVAMANVSGNITTPEGEPVKYVNIELEGMDDVNSDDDGNYLVENIPTGSNYTIDPVKVINTRNGISTSDMVMLNRHILGSAPITSPYQLIACDLTNNQAISTADLALMNKLILGMENTLDPSWKFVRSDYQFPDPTNPFMESLPDHIVVDLQDDMGGLDFIAIKIGDPNYSANPRRLGDFNQNTPALYLNALTSFEKDGTVDITITTPNDAMIEGMQFTLEFDPAELQYLDVSSTFGINPNLVLNTSELHKGRLGIVFINYNHEQSLDPLQLKFEALANPDLVAPLSISTAMYDPEGYVEDRVHPIKLRYEEIATETLALTVAPNPFNATTQLIIDSDQDQSIDISIMDMAGRTLSTKSTTIFKGTNRYTLQRADFENAGIYVIKLSNSAISRWTRVVLVD